MKIGFIGAGKVGFSLGKYLVERDQCVSGFYSHNLESSKEAAVFTKTKYYEKLEELMKDSDTLFLTVPDGSIREVYSEIISSDIAGKCLAHCSGALSSEVFSGISERGAFGYSIHPICAVSDKLTGYRDLSNAYFTIEGAKEHLADFQALFARLGNPVELLAPKNKVKYHAAAVFASNLVVALYDTASGLLEECGLSPAFAKEALAPLFLGNAKGIVQKGTMQALTGPVERADRVTVEKHLAGLNGETREIYRLLSKRLVEVAKAKHPDRKYDGLEELLEQERK